MFRTHIIGGGVLEDDFEDALSELSDTEFTGAAESLSYVGSVFGAEPELYSLFPGGRGMTVGGEPEYLSGDIIDETDDEMINEPKLNEPEVNEESELKVSELNESETKVSETKLHEELNELNEPEFIGQGESDKCPIFEIGGISENESINGSDDNRIINDDNVAPVEKIPEEPSEIKESVEDINIADQILDITEFLE